MFIRKPKIVDGWSVTRNPNKFDGDVILSLGSFKKDKVLKWIIKEKVSIRLNKDTARKLCSAILELFDE